MLPEALTPSSDDVIRATPPAMRMSADSIPSYDRVIVTSPPAMASAVSEWMPSSSVARDTVPR